MLTGLVLAIGLVFAFEYFDSRIKSPDEIKAHLNIPFLGLVPTVSLKDGEQMLLGATEVPPAFAESMKAIRTGVVFSSAEEGSRSVVVTSTAPHEGKTVVSSNLAAALAQTDQKVHHHRRRHAAPPDSRSVWLAAGSWVVERARRNHPSLPMRFASQRCRTFTC